MQVIGLCRFSYPAHGGFQVEHETIEERIAYLYGEARLEERFRLMETVALPCLKAQTDQDFTLVIVVGNQLPRHHLHRLERLVEDMPQALIHQEPPRKQREVMKEVLNEARLDPREPCLQFRHDDDDAVAVDFIERLRRAAEQSDALTREHKTVAFDWNQGHSAEFGAKGIRAAQGFRAFFVAALGMYVRGNCPMTIMNFAHEKIPRFMPAVSFPQRDMWVRGLNAFNDSRQKPVREPDLAHLDAEGEALFRDRFAIDADRVRRVFSVG
jgi:hypothetical protein